MMDAINCKSFDRHFLGLKILALTENQKEGKKKLPEIFTDVAFQRNNHFRISTSNVPIRNLHGGFGPVVEDGYGICYQLFPNMLVLNITGWKSCQQTNVFKMKAALEQSFLDVHSLFPFGNL